MATIYIPKVLCESVEIAVKLLGAQSKGLRTKMWKVLHVREEENGWIVAFGLDDSSVEKRRTLNYWANLAFKRVTFRIKRCPEVSTSGRTVRSVPASKPETVTSPLEEWVPATSAQEIRLPRTKEERPWRLQLRIAVDRRTAHADCARCPGCGSSVAALYQCHDSGSSI